MRCALSSRAKKIVRNADGLQVEGPAFCFPEAKAGTSTRSDVHRATHPVLLGYDSNQTPHTLLSSTFISH
jgi:hypothetical protein